MTSKIDFSEWGGISSEVNAMYQAGFLGFLFGAVYGGFISSRVAHDNFMNTNQATTFNSHFDAKKKLQNQVTVSFAKGAFRWGWRLALFTTSYVAITTTISVYRGKSSFVEYLTAGAVTGAAYKVNMGVRGVLVGGGLGLVLGGIAGGASLAILKASGNTMEEVRYWQYKWKLQRDQAIFESMRKQVVEDTLIDEHDVAVGTNNLSLEQLEVKPTKPNKPAPAKDKK